VPTLVTSGRYDECTPKLAADAANGIPGAEQVIFEESSHSAYAEEPEHFRAVLSDFLRRAEGA
jgi:pimeloyl-ACP methyl ester carboxylesterase